MLRCSAKCFSPAFPCLLSLSSLLFLSRHPFSIPRQLAVLYPPRPPSFFLRLRRRGFTENPRACDKASWLAGCCCSRTRGWRRMGEGAEERESSANGVARWVREDAARSMEGGGGGCQHRATNGDRFRVWVRRGRSPPGAARETRNPGS